MHNYFCPKGRWVLFCAGWILGLILGTAAAAHADLTVISWMRPFALRRVSIVLLLMWCCLPFLITAWAVLIQRSEILIFLVFCRCFFFSLLVWLELRAFGSAAWLMVPLSRFSDWLSLVLLCWFTLGSLRGFRKREFSVCLFLTVLVVIVDYFAVSPYVASL